jgi:hypothetical protein
VGRALSHAVAAGDAGVSRAHVHQHQGQPRRGVQDLRASLRAQARRPVQQDPRALYDILQRGCGGGQRGGGRLFTTALGGGGGFARALLRAHSRGGCNCWQLLQASRGRWPQTEQQELTELQTFARLVLASLAEVLAV